MHAYDFDEVIERRGTGCVKFDGAVSFGYPASVLPLWVADMDFPAAPPILEALHERARHGVFGYNLPSDSYYEAIVGWWRDSHGYSLKKEWILHSPSVVYSLGATIRALTNPGDSIIIQTPVYHPFYDMIQRNGRRLATNPLVYKDREYAVDFEAFQEAIVRENVKMFILCSPHNPVGRVWRPDELAQMGDICYRCGVIVVSDEIHCDLIARGYKHTMFAGLSDRLDQITVTLTSPSKTFNLSGLQVSHVFIANDEMRQAWMNEKKASGYEDPNAMGLAACQAAYEKGRPWLDQLLLYIDENERYAKDYLSKHFDDVAAVRREGTYLLWLDCHATPYRAEGLHKRLIEKGCLWLNDGAEFGKEGEGFLRLNLACPRKTLADAMQRFAAALRP
jgi:cystathionine beta-lyase